MPSLSSLLLLLSPLIGSNVCVSHISRPTDFSRTEQWELLLSYLFRYVFFLLCSFHPSIGWNWMTRYISKTKQNVSTLHIYKHFDMEANRDSGSFLVIMCVTTYNYIDLYLWGPSGVQQWIIRSTEQCPIWYEWVSVCVCVFRCTLRRGRNKELPKNSIITTTIRTGMVALTATSMELKQNKRIDPLCRSVFDKLYSLYFTYTLSLSLDTHWKIRVQFGIHATRIYNRMHTYTHTWTDDGDKALLSTRTTRSIDKVCRVLDIYRIIPDHFFPVFNFNAVSVVSLLSLFSPFELSFVFLTQFDEHVKRADCVSYGIFQETQKEMH